MVIHHQQRLNFCRCSKTAAAVFLLASAVLVFSGCAQSPESVRLESPKKLQAWCETSFGPCTVASVSKGEDSVTVDLCDADGFTYQAGSMAVPQGLDGAVFWYSAEKWSNFGDVYADRFLTEYEPQLDRICTGAGAVLDFDGDFQSLGGGDEHSVRTAGEAVMALVQRYDAREYWKNMRLYLSVRGTGAGAVQRGIGYRTQLDLDCEYLLEAAAADMQCSASDLEFISSEQAAVDDLPEAADFERASVLGTDNETRDTVLVVHFEKSGKKYYAADLVVYDRKHAGRIRHLGDYPVP